MPQTPPRRLPALRLALRLRLRLGLGLGLGLVGLALGTLPGQAQAQEVVECDWKASAANIAEPWEAHTRTFSNGKTRLALIDTIEPAGGALWLLILSPPYDELGDRQCRMVGYRGIGFLNLDFAAMQASYDPARGLTFRLPGALYGDGVNNTAITLSVTLNQATGAITPEVWR